MFRMGVKDGQSSIHGSLARRSGFIESVVHRLVRLVLSQIMKWKAIEEDF